MSTTNDDRELKLAQLLQELTEAESDSIGQDQITSKLDRLSDQELQDIHAAGNCLNLLR